MSWIWRKFMRKPKFKIGDKVKFMNGKALIRELYIPLDKRSEFVYLVARLPILNLGNLVYEKQIERENHDI